MYIIELFNYFRLVLIQSEMGIIAQKKIKLLISPALMHIFLE
jgi:hypothetical protein